MATRGIQQLQKLRIRYCEHGGSSSTIRNYLQQSPTSPNGTPNHLFQFATNNPAVQIIIQPRNGHHPYIQGEYRTGQPKQICIKNCTPQRIQEVMSMLVNTSGRKITRLGGLAVRGDCVSVQGVWTPMLNLGAGEDGESSFDIKIVE
jgi:large subunit ribosomal protein L43